MTPKLQPTSMLETIYHFYNGDINLFLEKSHDVIDNENLRKELIKELNLSANEDEQLKMNNQELWRLYFNQKLAEMNDYARSIEKAKEQEESYVFDLDAYIQLVTAQAKPGSNQTSQATSNPFLSDGSLPNFNFTTDIDELIKNGIVSQEYVAKLTKRTQDPDRSVQQNARRDLEFLKRSDIHNENKSLYSKHSDTIDKEDKEQLHTYLDKREYLEEDRKEELFNAVFFAFLIQFEPLKLNVARQQHIVKFIEIEHSIIQGYESILARNTRGRHI